MSGTQRLLLAFAILVVDILAFAIPLTAVAAAYVIAVRPAWFLRTVLHLYADLRPD
jgi:hypothetical protein